MPEYRGTHGTSASKARRIEASRFESSPGMHGVGAYFWRDGACARDLAKGWFIKSRRDNRYAMDSDKRCAIITASMNTTEEKLFDLTKPENKECVISAVKHAKKEDQLNIGKLVDKFIELVQSRSNVDFDIVLTEVNAPRESNYPTKALGQAMCYIVKNTACIFIESIETLEDSELSP